MGTIDLKVLVGHLDPVARRALEAAAGSAFGKTHYEIEIEHWLLSLLTLPESDFRETLPSLGIIPETLERALDRALKRCRTGSGRAPAFSPRIVALLREAWLLVSLRYKGARISALHLLAALSKSEGETLLFAELAGPLEGLDAAALEARLEAEPTAAPQQPAAGNQPNLAAYTIDLTELARNGRLDPVVGRDSEVRQVIDILTRRRQNNPILVGEAGVGKTAVVEALALRVAAGDVPAALRKVSIRTLDLGLLQAGAGVKGEFENRLKGVIDEVKAAASPVILFVDEAHTLIGAGGQAGQGDAANLLKPDLARGELRVIGATTWAEYKRHIEQDAALVRRFQPVKVEEPDEDTAIAMMRGLVETLEKHHGVRILDEAVRASVHLSKRYIAGRQLPDKCVTLLDTAAAMVAMSRDGRPQALEEVLEEIRRADSERVHLRRESNLGADHQAALAALDQQLEEAATRRAGIEARWSEERRLIDAIANSRAGIETGGEESQMAALRTRHAGLVRELAALQGEAPLLHDSVTAQSVAAVVARWTGIPVGRMLSSEIESALDLEARLRMRVVGQDPALARIADMLQAARAGINDPVKPPAVFLLVGPSGVGKTETALSLAEMMYGGEQSLTVINMSEFKEEHKVSLLMGAPPGYVGYGEGGLLTEAVRRRPYGVLLLDEMEKAHPGVQDIFYQLFDKGVLRDGEGRDVDFRNTTILMASNAGSEKLTAIAAQYQAPYDATALAEALHPDLLKHFKAAFLGRVTLVPYLPLGAEQMASVVELKLDRLRRRLAASHGAPLTVEPAAIAQLVERSGQSDAGARAIDEMLSRTVMPALSRRILETLATGHGIAGASIGWDEVAGEFAIEIEATTPVSGDATGSDASPLVDSLARKAS